VYSTRVHVRIPKIFARKIATRVGQVGEDSRACPRLVEVGEDVDVGVGVRVGVVECQHMVTFHGAVTDTDTDMDILADFRARIVHEPRTRTRILADLSARYSSRGCPLGMRACTRVRCTVHDKLSRTRLQNYTIGASLMSVSVSVSVSVPWNSSFTQVRVCMHGQTWLVLSTHR